MWDLNVFHSRMLNRIFWDINGIGIFTIYSEMFLTNTISKKKYLYPKKLSAATTNCNVFSLSSGEGYGFLLLTHPRNKIISQVKTPTRSTFTIINITIPVNIRVPSQNIISILIIPSTIVIARFNIFYDTLDSSNMRFFWVGLITSTYLHTIANVRSTSNKVKKTTYHAPIESRILTQRVVPPMIYDDCSDSILIFYNCS